MKTNAKILTLAICMLFSGLTISSFGKSQEPNILTENNLSINIFGYYFWNAAFGAVSYTVDLENVATGQKFNYETTSTVVSLTALPSGTYRVVVKAKFIDGNSSIIIEDLVDM